MKHSLDSRLQIGCICSIKIPSRNLDIVLRNIPVFRFARVKRMSLDELVQYGMKIKKLIKKEKFDDAATILNVLNGMMVFYSFFFA